MNANQRTGPFSKIDILNLVGKNTLALNDLIYDVRTSQWGKILDHQDFLRPENAATPAPKSPVSENTLSVSLTTPTGAIASAGSTQTQSVVIDPKHPQLKWSFKKGPVTLGPVNTISLLTMYKKGELKENDLVKTDKELEWKTIKKIFPAAMLEQISMMEPAQEPQAKLSFDNSQLNQLVYAGNKQVQHIVYAISITTANMIICTSNAVFKESEEVTIMFTSVKGRPISIPGVIAGKSTIPSQHDGFPLIKYTIKFNAPFSLANL